VRNESGCLSAKRRNSETELTPPVAADGRVFVAAKNHLDDTPIFDGTIVADDRLFVCTEQGDVICMTGE
jgi:hypothetical protein